MGGITGNMATRVKYWLGIDDALDVFAVHGICGIVGSLLVGVLLMILLTRKVVGSPIIGCKWDTRSLLWLWFLYMRRVVSLFCFTWWILFRD